MSDAPSYPPSGLDAASSEDWVVIVPPFGVPQPPPPVAPAPVVPSLTTPVVVTALIGPFGLIPAHNDGKRAAAVGRPASRYWKAFGLTFGAVVVAYALVWTLVLVSVPGGTVALSAPMKTSEAPAATQAPVPTTAAPSTPPQGALLWSAARIETVLDTFTDDETAEWAAFNRTYAVVVPCGGEGVFGSAPDLIESTNGGARFMATAELLPTLVSAEREVQRLSALLAACTGPFDYVRPDNGEHLTRCEAPVVASLAPVIRYEEICDNQPGNPMAYAIFQANNAVVALMAPTAGALDAMLPTVMGQLNALPTGRVLDGVAVALDLAAQYEARAGRAITLECPDDMVASLGATYQCRGNTEWGEYVVLNLTITSENPIAYTWAER